MGPSQVLSPPPLRRAPLPLTPAPTAVRWRPGTVNPAGVAEPVESSSSVAPFQTRVSMPPVATTLAEAPVPFWPAAVSGMVVLVRVPPKVMV